MRRKHRSKSKRLQIGNVEYQATLADGGRIEVMVNGDGPTKCYVVGRFPDFVDVMVKFKRPKGVDADPRDLHGEIAAIPRHRAKLIQLWRELTGIDYVASRYEQMPFYRQMLMDMLAKIEPSSLEMLHAEMPQLHRWVEDCLTQSKDSRHFYCFFAANDVLRNMAIYLELSEDEQYPPFTVYLKAADDEQSEQLDQLFLPVEEDTPWEWSAPEVAEKAMSQRFPADAIRIVAWLPLDGRANRIVMMYPLIDGKVIWEEELPNGKMVW